MKNLILITLTWVTILQIGFSQSEQNNNGSPYFIILNEDKSSSTLSLKGTKVVANVAGFVADVTVTQEYTNDGDIPLEAIYVFPSSTRSAVYHMEMKIGERIIKAKIKEKQQAKQEYNRAKSEGKRASLLEQLNPNVFQMNVTNILPGDKIEVSFKYNEFLIPESGEYSFIFPTVVGPRFASQNNDSDSTDFVSNPYLKNGTENPYYFELDLNLNSPVEISGALCSSHSSSIDFTSTNELKLILDRNERKGGNKDFIFKYKIATDKISNGTMLYEHDDENFFLSIIQPPKDILKVEISPREYIFIVDVSGSMNGFPLDVSKEMMKNLLSTLRPQDKFNVLLFASSNQVLSQMSLMANNENITKAFNLMDNQRGGGGTQLLEAVKRAMKLPKESDEYARSFIILTDGYVQVERETFQYIQDHLDQANFFAFGIGSSVNRFIIEGIAHQGRAESFIVTDLKYAKSTAKKFNKYIESPILTNIKLNFKGIDVYDLYPSKMPDLMAERPLYVFGKYKGAPIGKIEISGNQGSHNYKSELDFGKALTGCENSSLRYLWAREKLRYLEDFMGVEHNVLGKQEIINLGLKYNLLTEYTSFLAVDESPVLANADEVRKTVKQPLPLPSGASNFAVGFTMSAEEIKVEGSVLEKEEVYVVVSNINQVKKHQEIEAWIKAQFAYVDEEAKNLLHGKELILTLSEEGNYKIDNSENLLNKGHRANDHLTKRHLTKEQCRILNQHLMGLSKITNSRTIKITLLWL